MDAFNYLEFRTFSPSSLDDINMMLVRISPYYKQPRIGHDHYNALDTFPFPLNNHTTRILRRNLSILYSLDKLFVPTLPLPTHQIQHTHLLTLRRKLPLEHYPWY